MNTPKPNEAQGPTEAPTPDANAPPREGFASRFRRSVADTEARLLDPAQLEHTLQQLMAEGAVTEGIAARVHDVLPEQLERSRYVLRHLAAHLAIGAIFAFDVVPLPLGTISRIAWVAGNRVRESARGAADRARVHSTPVLLIAAIPWFGYAAYLLPLRRDSRELAFLLANQSWLSRGEQSYEAFLAEAHPLVRRLGRRVVPRPESEQERPVGRAGREGLSGP